MPAQIVPPQIISFLCIIKNRTGQVLSYSYNQDVINQHHPVHDKLPDLVDSLQAVHEGEERRFTIPATRAYGAYDPGLFVEIRRFELRPFEPLKTGQQIRWRATPNGEERVYKIIRIQKDWVSLDANHPFAGQDLEFDVKILAAREAKLEELQDDDHLLM
jgi:FKBP-type peptidyl-prolyl cis-trans isomerase SlyD